MAPKRPLESDSTAGPAAKKHRKGFRVGPQNLPDGPWKRKVDKIKKDLIHKAKVKKAYKKIKAAEIAKTSKSTSTGPEESASDDDDEETPAPPSPQLHPERQAMLDSDDEEEEEPAEAPEPVPAPKGPDHRPQRPRTQARKPGYFDKANAAAARRKTEMEARQRAFEERDAERRRKNEERERFRRLSRKARTPAADGQRKLGRESGLLLEKVKKMVGEKR
ncbi:hypothetical protein F5Y15DRAFT_420444 [Xylariaceae sp. FL0016]|nr:hypothetical protein F5Y15DRAFT_420444 [Xylariaceae sp. FL0016]